MRRFDFLRHLSEVSLDEGEDVVRTELVGLRITAAVDPGESWFPVGVEVDMLVGIVIGIWIEVNVIVVEAPWNVLFSAEFLKREDVFHRTEGFVGRPDVGKAIVIAPTLPVMDGQHGIDEAIANGVLHSGGDNFGGTAPNVEDKTASEIAEGSSGMFIRMLLVFDGGFKGGGGDSERKRAVLLHVEGGVMLREIDGESCRRRIDGRENTITFREI